jgi:hypothetical protein
LFAVPVLTTQDQFSLGSAITSGISFSQLAISAVSGTLEAGGELARLGLARKRGVIGAIDKAGS